jgi:hypothetical protein
MQTVTRYLLSNLVIGYISGYHGRNSKVYDRRITLHRGVSNPVSFSFKNEDQKAQDITAKTYEFNIIDAETKRSALTRNLTILDDGSTVSAKGTASVTITDGDLLKLEAKFYNFSVREVKSDNSREVTYADTGYNAAGTLEVIDGAYPDAINSTSVTSFTVTTGPLQYTSGAIDAKPGTNNNKALHTIAVYTKSFTGTVRVQGTMSASPADADYFNITMDGKANPTNAFSSSTGVTNYNFYGVYHSVRFSWDNDTDNTGIVDKILYRQ